MGISGDDVIHLKGRTASGEQRGTLIEPLIGVPVAAAPPNRQFGVWA